jgi:hypothetical protein
MTKIGKELETEKVATINVIEYCGDSLLGITSFNDNEVGNREAEIFFHRFVKDNFPETLEEEIEACIEDGYFEQGDYQIFLSHSN